MSQVPSSTPLEAPAVTGEGPLIALGLLEIEAGAERRIRTG